MSVYDLNMTVTGGLLKDLYTLDPSKVPVAYMRVITETNSTFSGSFSQDFTGLKAMTNVRAYASATQSLPVPSPEPASWIVSAVCAGGGLLYLRRSRTRSGSAAG